MNDVTPSITSDLYKQAVDILRRRTHVNLYNHTSEDIQRLQIAPQSQTYVHHHFHHEEYKKECLVNFQGPSLKTE